MVPTANNYDGSNKTLGQSVEAKKVDSIFVIDIAYHYHILAPV